MIDASEFRELLSNLPSGSKLAACPVEGQLALLHCESFAIEIPAGEVPAVSAKSLEWVKTWRQDQLPSGGMRETAGLVEKLAPVDEDSPPTVMLMGDVLDARIHGGIYDFIRACLGPVTFELYAGPRIDGVNRQNVGVYVDGSLRGVVAPYEVDG